MESFKNRLTCLGKEIATTSMSGTGDIPVGAPPAYGGTTDTLNPEELLVASVNSCIMLVFYHFANQRKVEVASYVSGAEGTVEKTKEGLRFTQITVKAEVRLVEDSLADKVELIANLAEKYCLVSNALSCPVAYSVQVTT